MPVLVEHARGVGQQHQLLRAQNDRELAGNQISVDIEAFAIGSDPDGCHDRDELTTLQQGDHLRVDGLDFANLPDVEHFSALVLVRHAQLPGANEGAILTCQTDGAPARLIDQIGDVLVHQAAKDHFDNIHGFTIGHAHTLDEFTFLSYAVEHVVDLGPAAMHHYRIQANQLQQHNVSGEGMLQALVSHRIAAILDDNGLAVKAAYIGQCLSEDLGLGAGVGRGYAHCGMWRSCGADDREILPDATGPAAAKKRAASSRPSICPGQPY